MIPPGWGAEGGTVPDGSISNAKLATMTAGTVKGRAVGAGTGAPTDLTGLQTLAVVQSAGLALVRANVGSDQGIATGAGWVTINYTIETIDTTSEYTAATPVYTASRSRRLMVYAQIRIISAAAGESVAMRIRHAGAAVAQAGQAVPANGDFLLTVMGPVVVAQGETVDVQCSHDSGSTRTIMGDNNLTMMTIWEIP